MRSAIAIKVTEINCSLGLFVPAVLAIALILSQASVVFAQALTDVAELPGMVVTAPADQRSDPDWVRPEKVLREDALRRKREAGLGDMLSREPGVSSSSFGPGASRPIIRGQDSSRTRVLESGVGMGDLSVISPDHAVASDTLNISRIEILRGPATLLYGSGTSGGVVNVISARIPDRMYKSAQGHFEGRFNSALEERSGVFSASGGHGQFAWHVDGAKRKTSDVKIPGRADPDNPDSENGVIRNSAIDSSNVSAGGSYIGERGYVGVSVSRLDNFYGIPGPESAKIDMDQTRYGLSGELDSPARGFQKLKMRINYNDYQHDELEDSGEIGTKLNNDEVDGRFELMHLPVANWQGVLGVQFQYQDFAARGEEAFIPSTLSHSVGIFMLEQYQWRRWLFEIGGRLEHVNRDPADTVLSSRNFNLYSISAGSAWMFAEGYQIDLTATRGQRAPIINALYANGIHVATNTFDVGDPDLTKETSNNFDLSLQKTDGAVTGRVNLFYNHINNYIFQRARDGNADRLADRVNDEGELDNNGAFLVQDFMQTRAHFYGLEAETRVAVLPERLTMRLFTDIVYGRLKNNGNVPRLTPLRFGLELDYFQGNWLGNFNVTRVTRQERTAALESETPGYILMNAELGYRFKRGESSYHTLFLQGRNLLNEDMRVHTSFLKDVAPLPGRAIVVGIRGTF
ncbi:iron complex outermembrane recepter protein [Nitrosomonas sp. Nm51]|uniref:TonB-dependent receptor n=1 Tax=Nitrosomonas sp. Nm51 TaxID=133720 RepID=UPI0008C3BD9C|nr:TonB-dependent receptor [Nitrosomonas sp. Nm51]SER24997.1 iron complex outermembrane recepter protein [Nitrosomonas sp. Nm51]